MLELFRFFFIFLLAERDFFFDYGAKCVWLRNICLFSSLRVFEIKSVEAVKTSIGVKSLCFSISRIKKQDPVVRWEQLVLPFQILLNQSQYPSEYGPWFITRVIIDEISKSFYENAA